MKLTVKESHSKWKKKRNCDQIVGLPDDVVGSTWLDAGGTACDKLSQSESDSSEEY